MAAINMNAHMFQAQMEKEDILLVDYWAPWCTYCRRISAAYDMVAQQNEGKMVVAKVNIDEEPQLAAQARIELIPTLVLYRNGKAIGSITAPDSKAAIDRFIQETLSAQ